MRNSMSNQILSASTLQGADVKTTTGDSIGDIQDLMIDVSSGEISYAVLSVSTGFLNLDSKYFAVPLGAFQMDHFHDDYDNYLVLDVSKERLENSPGFDKDNWPTHADSTFVDSVNTYYGMDEKRGYTSFADSDRAGIRRDESLRGDSQSNDSIFGDSNRDSRRDDSRRDNSLL